MKNGSKIYVAYDIDGNIELFKSKRGMANYLAISERTLYNRLDGKDSAYISSYKVVVRYLND